MSLIETINSLCMQKIGGLPNLENPQTYNDKINWLKIHDQQKQQIISADKYLVRNTIPEKFLIPLYYVSEKVEDRNIFPYVVKATHNSGGVQIVRHSRDLVTAKKRLSKLHKYGLNTGEWYYQFIEPRIIAEKFLPDNTDYKFHCVHGKVKWVQVIWDRPRAREAIFTPEGQITDLHMDEKMCHTPEGGKYPGDRAWQELTDLARLLSFPWRYVRVDLYYYKQPWFGELTFHPRAGCYKSRDEKTFGEMLDVDLTRKFEPVVM